MSHPTASLWDKLKGFLFHLFPHHLVSRITYWATRRQSFVVPHAIKAFIKHFQVDMRDAQIEDIQNFATFNEFFTRELKPNVRPIAQDANSIVCPCDGKISMHGPIEQATLIQAKNKYFTLRDFCTPLCTSLEYFVDGYFFTIYLSPRDYHRVHIPYTCHLLEMVYVPGRLFSVAPYAPRAIDKLYARNERVIPVFSLNEGHMAVAMVGAVNVAAIEMTWAGLITPPHLSSPIYYDYSTKQPPVEFEKGAQMGTFNMGSTVVLMFSKSCIKPVVGLKHNQDVKMGEVIATLQ